MSNNMKDREKRFWNNYLALLSDFKIKPDLYTWYVRHCETFIRTSKETRLKQHSKKSLSDYLFKLVNNELKKAWQKKQDIEALGFLFKCIHVPFH